MLSSNIILLLVSSCARFTIAIRDDDVAMVGAAGTKERVRLNGIQERVRLNGIPDSSIEKKGFRVEE